jgi:hypothetical protein
LPPFGGPWFGGLYKDTVWVNSTRIIGDASNARDLTQAEKEGRKNCFQLLHYFQKNIPGFEESRIVHTSPHIGVRETRRLVGEYTLTGDDIRSSHAFKDGIGLGCWSIDIHPTDEVALHTMYVPRPFPIPYRALLPKNVDGLLAAGRCISVDREALASIRVGAQCGVTGQAAGVAAALAVRDGKQPRQLDPNTIQSELRDQRAILEV